MYDVLRLLEREQMVERHTFALAVPMGLLLGVPLAFNDKFSSVKLLQQLSNNEKSGVPLLGTGI